MKKTHADLDSTSLTIRNLVHTPLQINIEQFDQLLSPNRINPFNWIITRKSKRNSVMSSFLIRLNN